MNELTRLIKEAARARGFDPVGVTAAGPLEEERSRLWAWLEAGRHGSMSYLARDPELRLDPSRLVPGARSVLALGMSYAPSRPGDEASGARVARYARGRDYHRLIRRRLRELEGDVASLSGRPFNGRTFVDTAPVLERPLASRAGLGFIGKHTLLIHPLHGSYLFLATLITDLELTPDEPARGSCGSCRLCLDACPTGALAPHQMDARRCLSYLTIERRGAIADELRPAVGAWAFGCDICQEVCPYNRHATPTREEALGADRGAGPALDLAEVLAIADEAAFLARFAGTALIRARREGLVRNACLAAAHLRRHDLVPRLADRLGDASPVVRAHAAWALGSLGGAPARAALARARAGETDTDVSEEMRAALEVATFE